MTSSEKEVAFRKRRREYAVNKPKNAIRAGTTIIRIKQPVFYRAETILASAQAIRSDKRKFDINTKRKASSNFPQPPDDLHVALVIRLVGTTNDLCPQTCAALTGLRLAQQFDGCFVPLTPQSRETLKSISHLIAYGSPSGEIVRQLVHTRAHTVVGGKETVVSANKQVADALGELDVEGLGDIVHVLNVGGDALKAVCLFLAPFHFRPLELTGMKKPSYAGGPTGWRGAEIGTFVEGIL
jgi:60S ribosomal protein uL30